MAIEGGCACGAVRYRAEAPPTSSMICHCASCRRASAAPRRALGHVRSRRLRLHKGAPAMFASSAPVRRGFCAACGTPLTYERDERPGEIDVTDLQPGRRRGLSAELPRAGCGRPFLGSRLGQPAGVQRLEDDGLTGAGGEALAAVRAAGLAARTLRRRREDRGAGDDVPGEEERADERARDVVAGPPPGEGGDDARSPTASARTGRR